MDEEQRNSDTKDLLAFVQKNYGAQVHSVSRGSNAGAPFAVVPKGMEVQSLKDVLDEYKPEQPERKTGTTRLTTIESFVAHANRAKDTNSAIFAEVVAEQAKVTLRAVYDYHPAGGPEVKGRWLGHGAIFEAPMSEAWLRWKQAAASPMGQTAFAELIEERMVDLLPVGSVGPKTQELMQQIEAEIGDPSVMLKVSRGLEVHTDQKIKQAVNLSTGGVQLHFEETQETKDKGGNLLSVPGAFVLGIPVFRGGAVYQLPVRLRYRKQDSRVHWLVNLFRADLVFDVAAREAIEKVRAETALPVFYGLPENAPTS